MAWSPPAATSDVALVHLEGNFPGGTVDLKYRFTLNAKLKAASALVDRGSTNAAINQLNALINEVDAQRGKKTSTGDADALIAAAQAIIAAP